MESSDMTNRLYSAFDPSAVCAGLDLSQSNTIIAVNQTTDINRTARRLRFTAYRIGLQLRQRYLRFLLAAARCTFGGV